MVMGVVSVVVNDGTFATVLGITVTSCFALMAYIVKTLSAIDSRLAVVVEKVGGLERREAQRWGGTGGAIRVRLALAIIAIVVLIGAFWGSLYLKVESDAARRQDACVSRRNLYDGQITYTRFLGRQLGATPDQIDVALAALHKDLGTRPQC